MTPQEMDTLTENDLVIVNFLGKEWRARVCCRREWADPEDIGETGPLRCRVQLGALPNGLPKHPRMSVGDEADILPDDIQRAVTLRDVPALDAHFDWCESCLRACQYNAGATGEAMWEHVLEKAWHWLREAWLGGMDGLEHE